MWWPPLRDQENERPRIALDIQFAFLAVVARICYCDGSDRRCGAGAIHASGGSAGDCGFRFHAMAKGCAVALGDRRLWFWDSSPGFFSIHHTHLPWKTILPIATSYNYIRMRNIFWKHDIREARYSPHGLPAMN